MRFPKKHNSQVRLKLKFSAKEYSRSHPSKRPPRNQRSLPRGEICPGSYARDCSIVLLMSPLP